MLQYLDQYCGSVKDKVAHADSLFLEAKKNLAHFKELDRMSKQKIKLLHKHMLENARIFQQEAEKSLAEKINARERIHKERLLIYERERIERVKELLVQRALVLARAYLKDHAASSFRHNEVDGLVDAVRNHNMNLH